MREENMSDEYAAFIASKRIAAVSTGIADVPDVGDYLFPFQADLVRWSLRRGRAAIFADTGLGKTIMMCEWASHIVDHVTDHGEGDSVLILAPLAVADQTVKEAAKFGIDVHYCRA